MLSISSCTTIETEDDYPKSRGEREMEEMGSLAGGEGLVFRPSLTKSQATKKTIGKVNEYSYTASLEEIKKLGAVNIEVADPEKGIIITDWYSNKENPNKKYKIYTEITSDQISPESVNSYLFEMLISNIENDSSNMKEFNKEIHSGNWSKATKRASDKFTNLEEKIVRRARELYLEDKSKKK
ncbi:MAG: DUF3576 domain-containing protein [Rickettsiaceae bacterium]|nr:DUF3576 domain-containing protein [Rickettsiaceae bacterium]